jgi:hypothetical protein
MSIPVQQDDEDMILKVVIDLASLTTPSKEPAGAVAQSDSDYENEHPAAKRMRLEFEVKYGRLSPLMQAANHWFNVRTQWNEAWNRDREVPVTEHDVAEAERAMLAAAPGAAIAAREQKPRGKRSLAGFMYRHAVDIASKEKHANGWVRGPWQLTFDIEGAKRHPHSGVWPGFEFYPLYRDLSDEVRTDTALASRQQAPVASGEPTDAQIRKTISDAQQAWCDWRGNDPEDSFVGAALRKLFASPSGAGLGGEGNKS